MKRAGAVNGSDRQRHRQMDNRQTDRRGDNHAHKGVSMSVSAERSFKKKCLQ